MAQAISDDDIRTQVHHAMLAGKWDEAKDLMKHIPLVPEVANAAKQAFGDEYLKQSGFNLSAAEKAYGNGWISR